MKNKISYGILIFLLIISDLVYIGAFISGGFIPDDTGGSGYILLLVLINTISFIIGLIKIKKQKLIACLLIILSLPTIISFIWMYTHKNDFSPNINKFLKANLTNARWQIDNIYQLNQSYSNICEDINVAKSINEVKKMNVETKCFSDNDSYVLSFELKRKPKENDRYYGYNYLCLDSTGKAESIKTSIYQSIINADTPCSQ